jgi:hypothetical protein
MNSVHMPVKGFWPEDIETLKPAFEKVFAQRGSVYVLIGGGEQPDPMEQIQAGFARIGLCDPAPKP